MTIAATRSMDNADAQREEEIERCDQTAKDETRSLHERRVALKNISTLVKIQYFGEIKTWIS